MNLERILKRLLYTLLLLLALKMEEVYTEVGSVKYSMLIIKTQIQKPNLVINHISQI
jgi:hypothetical protein